MESVVEMEKRRNMKRFIVRNFEAAASFEEAESRSPAPGEALIAMHHVALNHADLLMAKGRYQDTPALPFALGLEGAGVVVEAGADCAVRPGARVAVFAGHGCLSEKMVVPGARLVPVPDGLDLAEAAALPIAYATAHLGLVRRARAEAGETLIVTGAGGGAGLAAVRLGRALGLRVIALARSDAHLDAAREAGAAEVLDSEAEAGALTGALRGLGAAEIVYDTVGGPGLAPVLRAVKPEGRVLLVGFVGGLPELKPNHLLVKNQTVIGLNVSAYHGIFPGALTGAMAAVFDLAVTGEIDAGIGHRFAFDAVPEALDLLRNRKAMGKIVIDMPQSSA